MTHAASVFAFSDGNCGAYVFQYAPLRVALCECKSISHREPLTRSILLNVQKHVSLELTQSDVHKIYPLLFAIAKTAKSVNFCEMDLSEESLLRSAVSTANGCLCIHERMDTKQKPKFSERSRKSDKT